MTTAELPTFPIIRKHDVEKWCFKVSQEFRIKLPIGGYFRSEWGSLQCGWLTIRAGYAFDGATAPLFKDWFDAQPGILAASLIHDILLQARKKYPDGFDGIGISFDLCTEAFQYALRLYKAPCAGFVGIAVEAWFNPLFNLFRS